MVSGAELCLQEGQKVLIGDKSSVAVAQALGYPYINIARSPVADLEFLKNPTEVEGSARVISETALRSCGTLRGWRSS